MSDSDVRADEGAALRGEPRRGGGELNLGRQVEKRNLVDIVVERLTEAIGSGGLRTGDDLPSEATLAELLGVSRPVIREGLRHLTAFGMVKQSSGKPARVMPLNSKALSVYFDWAVREDPSAIIEIQQLRGAVEGVAASLAAERMDDAERQGLSDLLDLLEEARSDIEEYARLDVVLHLRLTELSRNSLLFAVIDASKSKLEFVVNAGLKRLATMPEGISDVHRQHAELVAAVIAGDARRARDLAEAHVVGAAGRIIHELELAQQEGPDDGR